MGMESLQSRLGARLRTLREKTQWSQEALAARAGFHRTYVGAVERGEQNLTLRSMHALAETLGVKLVDLVRGIDD